MLKKLNPDQLEDLGDFISDICDLTIKFTKEREMAAEDICFSLLYMSMSFALEEGFSKRSVEKLTKDVLKLVLEAKQTQK